MPYHKKRWKLVRILILGNSHDNLKEFQFYGYVFLKQELLTDLYQHWLYSCLCAVV